MGRLTRNDRQVPDGWQVVRLGDVAEVNRHSWNPTDGTSSILYLDLTAVMLLGQWTHMRRIRARTHQAGHVDECVRAIRS